MKSEFRKTLSQRVQQRKRVKSAPLLSSVLLVLLVNGFYDMSMKERKQQACTQQVFRQNIWQNRFERTSPDTYMHSQLLQGELLLPSWFALYNMPLDHRHTTTPDHEHTMTTPPPPRCCIQNDNCCMSATQEAVSSKTTDRTPVNPNVEEWLICELEQLSNSEQRLMYFVPNCDLFPLNPWLECTLDQIRS